MIKEEDTAIVAEMNEHYAVVKMEGETRVMEGGAGHEIFHI